MTALFALGLLGCEANTPTQILVEVDTDLLIPDQVDTFTVVATAPDGRVQRAVAALGPGLLPPPRTVTLLYREGALSPFEVTVSAETGGTETVRRSGVVAFRPSETRVWRVQLASACVGVACEAGETCEAGTCRPDVVGEDELEPWDGTLPPQDAGAFDACQPDERCNGVDDDCDGMTDEGFDIDTDPSHCGGCGQSCMLEGVAEATCSEGSCGIVRCEDGRDNCDGVESNGCETDLTTSAAHCGGCGNACRPPERECCASSCARSCG
ncbi:MAG: hypothetical protein AB8I08_09685 [Sandaracinaceae bacterium]